MKLLENAMSAAMQGERSGDGWSDGRGRFLIDGFPRKMDQALKFEEEVCGVLLTEFALTVIFRQVCISSLVVVFTTTEEVMVRRLLERGKTSGRDDDNEESIKKRFGISLFKPQSHRKLIFT